MGNSLEVDSSFDFATSPAATARMLTTGNKVIKRISARSMGFDFAQNNKTVQPSINAPATRVT
jgi:hypothetical protein